MKKPQRGASMTNSLRVFSAPLWPVRQSRRPLLGIIGIFLVSLAAADAGAASHEPPGPSPALPAAHELSRAADFEAESVSAEARHLTNWVLHSENNKGMPFVIVDKANAKVFLFSGNGRLRGAAPALLGLARGDDSVPGIGDRKLSTILPEERTTPAGRFVAALGPNLLGQTVLWVDYDAAISLHRVLTSKPEERRLERLRSASPLEHRITYGCINVPARFYDKLVRPTFSRTNGIVYVLPETRSARKEFASYDPALLDGKASGNNRPQ